MQAKTYTLGTLADMLRAELHGDPECPIYGLATLREAGPGSLTFLSNPAYISQLAETRASAVILEPRFLSACPTAALVTAQPYVTYAHASHLFASAPVPGPGVHPTAIVDASARLGQGVSIGPRVVVGPEVEIGAGSIVEAGSVIGAGCRLGDACHLHANVTLYHQVKLGHRVEIHSAAVIGADGFGFASDAGGAVKIAQLGSVEIGNDVEIGAGTTIDRGALQDTVIGNGVKIDNQVQIGHNCRIGQHTVICGCTAIAGSAEIGEFCVLGGASGMIGHIRIASGVKIAAMSLVSQPVDEPGVYSSGTGLMDVATWKRNIVRFRELDAMARRIRELEKITGQLIKQDE